MPHKSKSALFDSAPVMMLSVSRNTGLIRHANRAITETLGYPPDSLDGRPVIDLYSQGSRAKAKRTLARFQAGERIRDVEVEVLAADGSTIPVEISVTHVIGPDGEEFSCSVLHDVRQRKRVEAQMLQAQKLESLGLMAGGIAHDFNNILMVIMGNADLALSDPGLSNTSVESIHGIQTASRSAADLCRQMLAYSGHGRKTRETVSISDLVQDMMPILRSSVPKAIALQTNFSKLRPATVNMDVSQLRQIILNLCINASESIEGSGMVSLSTGVSRVDRDFLASAAMGEEMGEGQYAFLEVSDNGCGMTEETKQRLFEPFFSTKHNGRGLGMAAVFGAVRGHQGAVRIYSVPDQGTTIKVLIPWAEAHDAESLLPPEVQMRGTVLVADDEPLIRKVLTSFLLRLGFETIAVGTGREALSIFQSRPGEFAMVILDLNMPGISGEQAFRELRGMTPGTPVLMLSGYNHVETVTRLANRGAAAFLAKPFSFQEFRSTLQDILPK